MAELAPSGSVSALSHSDLLCYGCFRYFRFEGDLLAHQEADRD